MNTPDAIDGGVALSHWGVIRAQGADATKFLQSQLTSDVAGLTPTQFELSGFCSAKGRLQASFLVWRPADDDVYLACAASVLEATLKRLSMFVLRAQCRLSDATAQTALHGLVGATASASAAELEPWQLRQDGARRILRLPDAAGLVRCIAADGAGGAGETSAASIDLETWRWLELQSGVPLIEAATVDRFVPQMLNFELLRGVDFHKGCYPGQEVVARSQYRGTIKRRTLLFDSHGAAAAGQEVYNSLEPAQPAGIVVNAARKPGGGWSALIEVKWAALEAGSLHLGSTEGAALERRELPYVVLGPSA